MSFAAAEENPPPPFYALDAPWSDQPDLDTNGRQKITKGGKSKSILGYPGKSKGAK